MAGAEGSGARDYDVVVVGSGFGGSVSALRLTEKGYRVAVLEAGRRFSDAQLPRSSWRVRDYVFAPALRCFGILRVTVLPHVVVLTGAGVGGGSLAYANTLYDPPDDAFEAPGWAASAVDWRAELEAHLDQARRMLGVVDNPVRTAADDVVAAVAAELGRGHTVRPAPVGVLFGAPAVAGGVGVGDPFFGGVGPARTTCTLCGDCLLGCRVGAKNTLVRNYLALAEQAGAVIWPMTTVRAVRPLPGGGWALDVTRTGRRRHRTLTADQVVLAASALGTQALLHRMRDAGTLRSLSPRLGQRTRTNSEEILAPRTRRRDVDFSRGVTITSSFRPDAVTQIEPAHYGRGSNLVALVVGPLRHRESAQRTARAGPAEPSRRRPLADGVQRLRTVTGWLAPRRWSEQTIALLVMQSVDNALTVTTRRGVLGGRRLTTRLPLGEPATPRWLPVAHDVARRVARRIDGVALGTLPELLGRPVTGHVIGGCAIGTSPDTGVVDPYHRVFGHPGLHVVDGSVLPANLGVNPALTITALAERALALWPCHGDPDPRPALGGPYRRVDPVSPRHPVVPSGAPGALRWAGTRRGPAPGP